MPFDLPAEHVLPLVESRDGRRAMEARSAWDWLTASGDVPVVTLHALQYFLWYQLPAKFLTDLGHHREVAKALADLLSELGYEDAAALARGVVTMRVLAEWDSGPSRGHRAFRKAMDESGVEPPDTDALEWGDTMGMTEAGVYHMAAAALEQAMSEGAFVPGRRGWRQAQAEAMRRFLATPLHSLDERTPQAAVWEERRELWAAPPRRPLRQAILEDVRDRVRRMPATPDGVPEHLRPLLRFLEIAAASPRLTQAGYLPPPAVRELTGELRWWRWEKQPRSEADVPPIMTLRGFAREAGLVRTAAGRLALTPAGRRSLTEPTTLWERMVTALAAGRDFVHVIRELLLVRLLRGPDERGLMAAAILPILHEAGWKPADGRVLSEDMVSHRLWDAVGPMELLGMIEVGEWPDRSMRLTEFGSVTAAAILWRRSTAPGQSIL
jgi:hypothetical protein